MRAGTYWQLIRAGKMRITPSRIPMFCSLSMITPFNDLLAGLQSLRYRKRLLETAVPNDPVFIIGHWRSGTTLLHELLMLDPRNVCPNTYQCFAPNHFLVSEWFFRRFGNWLLPAKRPMDNVIAGWDRPQEDEFALMNLGLPSSYRRIAFPRNPPPDMEYLDFQGVSDDAIARWLDGLKHFLRALLVANPGRVVLKSPTHTGRIAILAKAFPGAKFIHIARDPRALFPSTLRLWLSLDSGQAFQKPPVQTDRQYVIDCLRRMYDAFHRDRAALREDQLVDIRYEELVADPQRVLRSAYDQLELGNFDPLADPLQQWIDEHHRGYQPNEHHLPPADEALIRSRWNDYFVRYGYA